MTSRSQESSNAPTFEESFERLEAVVTALESGQTPLNQSLKLYEEGVQLIRLCHEKLTGARRKIEMISGQDANGNPVTSPLQEDDRSLEEKSQTHGR